MPDYWRDEVRSGSPTPADRMAAHGNGSAHTPDGCDGGARCEAWKDAHMDDVLAVFREKPIVQAALARAEQRDQTAAE